jgi:CheY-like chemotaxis protein
MYKILVVEDEPIMRNLLRLALSSSGYDIIEARDGDEGLIKAREEKPDLVVTDLVMPVVGLRLGQ